MALSFSSTLRNNRLDQITTAAGTSALLRIYDNTGGVPAVGTAITTQVLLAELTCNATAFAAAATGGVLTLNAISQDTSANANGTASFFRIVTSGGTTVLQGTVGTSGADLNLNSVAISSGAAVSVTAFTITEANS